MPPTLKRYSLSVARSKLPPAGRTLAQGKPSQLPQPYQPTQRALAPIPSLQGRLHQSNGGPGRGQQLRRGGRGGGAAAGGNVSQDDWEERKVGSTAKLCSRLAGARARQEPAHPGMQQPWRGGSGAGLGCCLAVVSNHYHPLTARPNGQLPAARPCSAAATGRQHDAAAAACAPAATAQRQDPGRHCGCGWAGLSAAHSSQQAAAHC